MLNKEKNKASSNDAENKKNQIKSLEQDIKNAYKESDSKKIKDIIPKLKTLDPENNFGEKLLNKVLKKLEKNKKRQNTLKIKEYNKMIKQMYKNHEWEKVTGLAKELKEFYPSLAEKWMKKVLENKEKMTEKKAEKTEKTTKKTGEKGILAKMIINFLQKKKKTNKQDKTVIAQKQKTEIKIFDKQKSEPEKNKSNIETEPLVLSVPQVNKEGISGEDLKNIEPQKEIEGQVRGNVFTKVFGKKDDLVKSKKSIIDTIVAKTSEETAKKTEKKIKQAKEKTSESSEKKLEGVMLINLSRAVFHFGIAFIILSATFFYIHNMDSRNIVLGLIGTEENYAKKFHNAAQELTEKKEEEAKLTEEIRLYKEGYNNKYEKIIGNVVENRLNWPDIMDKINDIADYIYERNNISQYIKFNGFSFDAKQGTVRVSGSLSDPLGKNLTKMAEFEEAFRYFPKNKNNPDDQVKPYFYSVNESSSFSKSYNASTGKYISSFQISFSLNEPKEDEYTEIDQ